MSALTSLLVRDRVVPVSKIAEALQTQVFSGGDIEVVLLEMNALPEDVLSAYRAALFDLLPATREEVMRGSREALRRVPADLARALGIVPIFFEGRSLVVAAWEPLYEPRLGELESQLGCELSIRIVNQPRLASALAHHYGFELDVRMRRLSDALRKRDPGIVPYVRPPSPSMLPMALLPARHDSESDSDSPSLPDESKPSAPSAPQPAAELDSAPAAPAVAQAAAPTPPRESERAAPTRSERVDARLEAEQGEALEADDADGLPTGVSAQLAGLVRGPVSLERATEILRHASQRDDVLFVLLRYVQQHFDFACIFSVGKEGVRARMAHGAGVGRELIQHAFVPTPRAGLFADAIRSGRPVLGEFGTVPEEQGAQALLHRQPGRAALVMPLEFNGRVILLVYVERVRAGLGPEHASVVQAVLPAVLAALRRIILESKAQRRSSAPPAAEIAPAALSEERAPAPSAIAAPTPPAQSAVEPEAPVAPTPVEASTRAGESARELSEVSAVDVRSADEEPAEVEPSSDLSAIDLDAFERLSRDEPLSDPAQLGLPAATDVRRSAQLRERIAGVPRTAPPPPAYDTQPAVQAASMRYRSVAGLAKERAPGVEKPAVMAKFGGLAESVASTQRAADEAPSRQRLTLVEPVGEVPSVIIDMGESIAHLVESLNAAAPGSEPPEIEDLLQLGETALPALMQRFPGALWFDRTRPYKLRPRGRDVSAIARAMAAFGERAAPYLASLLGSTDADTCFYAMLVGGEIVHPDLLDPVARRVLDPDDGLRALALDVLRRYSVLPQYEVVLRALADLSERPGKDPRRQRLAVEALGQLRDSRALPVLLARLSDPTAQIQQAAHRALVVLTGQDFGLASRRWETWAEGWRRAHRAEWLIESLLHGDESVRALASEELKALTQQYFGYHPALPKRDREVAQRKYREWWELEGRAAFQR